MLKIEKNIPVPRQRYKYPFREMEIGDSFVVDDVNNRSTMYASAKQAGIKIATRSIEGGKLRVWRVK